jgi:septal ring factor EnvC (AmiA/AmiB activator)
VAQAEEEPEASEGGLLLELREQILEARERVGEQEQKERQIFARLEEIDRKVDALTRQVAKAKRAADSARLALRESEAGEAKAQAMLDRTREAMSKRVVGLYKTGEVGPLRVLFSSNSLPELISRATFLRKLLDHDSELVERFKRQHRVLAALRAEAQKRARLRDETARQLEDRNIALSLERGTKTELLAVVRSDRSMERAMLVELERAARALEEKLVALGESSRLGASELDDGNFESLKGSLPTPVRAETSSRFGLVVDAEFGTETFNKGVEFKVSLGDSIRAVAFGEVRYSGWFLGYGKIVILDHGNQYFTVSGHLADIFVEVGQTVDQGDTLATAGESGSLTGPSFYFEVRRGGEPLDPMAWLQ